MKRFSFSWKIWLYGLFMVCITATMAQAQTQGTPLPTTTSNSPGQLSNPANPPNKNSSTGETPPPNAQQGNDGVTQVPENNEFESDMEQQAGEDGYIAQAFVDSLQIYGSELFANSFTYNRNLTNRPTPLNYNLGPGDQLLIDITGVNVVSFAPTVQPDGSISLREFGRVYVGGRTIEEARDVIKQRLNSNRFSIDKGSSLDVNITNVRSFTVTVMGQVVNPGSKVVGTFNTVLDALNLAGGITNIGSYRHIQIIRNNRIFAEVDLYEMIAEADFSSNYFLEDNDMIVVPIFRKRVAMTGELKREGWFEVRGDETLWNIIEYAGGFTATAYTPYIKAIQNTDDQKRVRDIRFEDLQYFNPINGDRYVVDRILERLENRVSVQGAVFRPGFFELETTPSLLKLVEKAGGLKEEAFTTRAYLTRTNAETGALENITIDLEGILNGKVPDIVLQREDVLSIKSVFEMSDQSTVTIAGRVRNPGMFTFYQGMTIEDLVMQANGFADGADYQTVYVSRRVKDSDRKSKDAELAEVFTITVDPYLRLTSSSFELEPFDVVSVMPVTGYVTPEVVEIEGQVMRPGSYSLTKRSERISDLLKRAGGITELGDIRGATLFRPSEKTTYNERALKEYRTQLRKSENQAEFALDSISGGLKISEEAVQLNPNIIAIDLNYILKNPGSDRDLILRNGDRVSIPFLENTVEIQGQVGFPTIAVYQEGKELMDYIIDDAGGFTENANKRRTKVEYRNGRSSTKKLMGSFPRVEPGATIYVPAKAIKERKGFDIQSFVALSTSIVSSAAVIITLLRLN